MFGTRVGADSLEGISGLQCLNPILGAYNRQGTQHASYIEFVIAHRYQLAGMALPPIGFTRSVRVSAFSG